MSLVLPREPHPADFAVILEPKRMIDLTEIGEFRHVVSIFISFAGISTHDELHDWACVLLANIKTFGGYFHRMNFGDKGGFVLCGFGAPVTFENLIDRALDFLLAVKKDLKGFKNLSGLRYRAGTTYGIAYAGIAGGKKRCEYTYHGEVVNLAARFMMKADWGEIFVSDAIRDNTVQFNFTHKGNFLYKGIAEPVFPETEKLIRDMSSDLPYSALLIPVCHQYSNTAPVLSHRYLCGPCYIRVLYSYS